MDKQNVKEVKDVVIRFSGDSGDGMQLTGTLFSDTSALMGNGISTFPDYPAEIRAPQGTVSGVSGFQVHFGSNRVINPGDYCDVLVAMTPAALKANSRWLKPDSTIIIDGDTLNEKSVEKAGFKTLDPIAELGLENHNIVIPNITSMTKDALADMDLDNKSVTKCKNMFAPVRLCKTLCRLEVRKEKPAHRRSQQTCHGRRFQLRGKYPRLCQYL